MALFHNGLQTTNDNNLNVNRTTNDFVKQWADNYAYMQPVHKDVDEHHYGIVQEVGQVNEEKDYLQVIGLGDKDNKDYIKFINSECNDLQVTGIGSTKQMESYVSNNIYYLPKISIDASIVQEFFSLRGEIRKNLWIFFIF